MKPSRRSFLGRSLCIPLAAGRALLAGAPLVVPAQEMFESPQFVRYGANCFTLNDRDTFIYSAAFHYPRCPRALWRDRLVKLQRAGFNTIETYIFWNYHEREEGRADLSEFEEFIKLVKEMGFWMIARPGPYVCAEWQRGGIPDWVAAKRFPLRSNHSENVKASLDWFRQVLPVIRRHQITASGPIIMVQVENEYDYWQLPDAEKREYLRALARTVWESGIKVPVFTCLTKQARENADPDMARIMDTCNFYPRWNILKQVPPALAKLRQEEPNAPIGIAELQGGWFSQFGGKLSVEQEGVDAPQFNALTKTVIEHGVTHLNLYMAFGGTNFDWASKTLTTTYDYAAPLREPGGLWEKYYAARGIGASLSLLGRVLTRAQLLEGVPQSTNASVSVTQRVSGQSAVVFVRENSNAEQRVKVSFRDPDSPTQRVISAPRQGELTLGPREMKMLPVQVAIAGTRLRYSTAEVLAHGLVLDRHYLIVYDEPGRLVEISLATEKEPQVEGDVLYRYWDPEYESVVFGVRVEKTEKILVVNNDLLLVVAPRARALRSWVAEFPPKVVPGAEETKPMAVPFLTDSYFLSSSGSAKKSIWAELEFLRGEHLLTVLLPPDPVKCRVDGFAKDFLYARPLRTARLKITTPPLAYQPVSIDTVQAWVEKLEPHTGEWLTSAPRPLEELGAVPYGYVKYRAQFSYGGQPKMFITTFGGDAKKVFLNGRLAAEASNAKKEVEFALRDYVRAGSNAIEIIYEAFGSPHFGPNLGELKGIQSVRYGSGPQEGQVIETWQIQRFAPPIRRPASPGAGPAGEIDPAISREGWQPTVLTGTAPEPELVPAFTWCRAEFALPKLDPAWSVVWKLTFEAQRDALLYLNGKFIGRYVTVGPQKDFYLPEPYFAPGGKNVLTIMLAYADQPQFIRTLRIAPYEEFSTRRTRVEFEW